MSDTLDLVSKTIKVANELTDSSLPVIAVVIVSVISVAMYKFFKMFINHLVVRERRYGRVKAMAISYKVKYEDVTPETAMLQLDEALKDKQ